MADDKQCDRDKSNWFKSLSRRHKSSNNNNNNNHNKENNQQQEKTDEDNFGIDDGQTDSNFPQNNLLVSVNYFDSFGQGVCTTNDNASGVSIGSATNSNTNSTNNLAIVKINNIIPTNRNTNNFFNTIRNTIKNKFLTSQTRHRRFLAAELRREFVEFDNNSTVPDLFPVNEFNLSNRNFNVPVRLSHFDMDMPTYTVDANCYMFINLDNHRETEMIRASGMMSRYGWYWGTLSRCAAQKKLQGRPNGSFLVRRSQSNAYNFTVSFRSVGITLHYRIEFSNGFWLIESIQYKSMVELIEDTMKKSETNVFCYVKQDSQLQPPFPVRLLLPVSKFGDVPRLQCLCRNVIVKKLEKFNDVNQLPLPTKMKDYILEYLTIIE